ncbi:MAG: prephenate dehydrogenase [Ruminococcus sp.]|nr:prephenate dehydrogenase [Ruminococcus sp.]
MNIVVVGLGLIGGSICKALKKYSNYRVTASDLNRDIEAQALKDGSIDEIFSGSFDNAGLVIICLYPEAAESYFRENAPKISGDTLITEVCGIKGDFSRRMNKIALDNNLNYIGIHPMAGKEVGGYSNSFADLFAGANFIITPFEDADNSNIELLKKIVRTMGAGKIVVTSPENHDKMIAYTSQLAHVVSSAYVKSPELNVECGFSGGSFQDMTRIATMNEVMWTDLFMQNRDNLKFELDTLIENLKKYSEALDKADSQAMTELIREGRLLKEENLRKRIGQPN